MRKISRVFELYRPKILTEFLQFIKDNPEEPFVYVLQHPPQNINIMSASDFGYLVICLPENSQMMFSPAPFIHKMRKNLRDFKEKDYILCTGDPAIIGLSTAIVTDVTGGRFNLLKWDRQERRYYPLTFNLYDKDTVENMSDKKLDDVHMTIQNTSSPGAAEVKTMAGQAIMDEKTARFKQRIRRIEEKD